MKSNDTKRLEYLYGAISNASTDHRSLIFENTEEVVLKEEIVNVLGMDNAKKLIRLIKNEIPACNDDICKQRLEKESNILITDIKNNVDNNMIQRTLFQYKEIPMLSQVKMLYNILKLA